LIKIRGDSVDLDRLKSAAEAIRSGRLTAFPTETVYGLGADATNAEATAAIFKLKGRSATNPVIVHVANVEQAKSLTLDWNERAERLADRFWPGPLTIVVKANDRIPSVVTAGGSTVGLRAPNHPIARALIELSGRPIAAPSANRSEQLSPTRAEHVAASFDQGVDWLIDGGPCQVGVESTVVDATVDPVRILRPGAITAIAVAESLGSCVDERGERFVGGIGHGRETEMTASSDRSVERPERVTCPTAREPVRSPGMMSRHYAPSTPLILASDSGVEFVLARLDCDERVGWLTFPDATKISNDRLLRVDLPFGVEDVMRRLYDLLRRMDCARLDVIVASRPPDRPEWSAVLDRLTRAAVASSQPGHATPRKEIAVGIVLRGDEVLVGKRSATVDLPGRDEFPGGKVETGEAAESAVVREVAEETGVNVVVERTLRIVDHDYAHGRLRIRFFLCRPVPSIGPADTADRDRTLKSPFRWLARRRLIDCDFPAANGAVLNDVAALPIC
jgi:L-threonylcarbamoyladenylate synthase